MSWFTYFRIDKLQALFLTCCMPYFSIWLLYSHVQAVLFSYKRNDILHIMFYTSLIDRLHAVISLSACRTFKILRELTCCMCIFTSISTFGLIDILHAEFLYFALTYWKPCIYILKTEIFRISYFNNYMLHSFFYVSFDWHAVFLHMLRMTRCKSWFTPSEKWSTCCIVF